MTRKLTPDQLDEIEAAAKKATPGPWVAQYESPTMGGRRWTLRRKAKPGIIVSGFEYGDNFIAEHVAMMDPATTLALIAEVRELRAKVEGATQQPAIDTLYGEGASSDLWRTALGLERTYGGFCATGDHYCLQSVGHYCQGDQQFIEELKEEA